MFSFHLRSLNRQKFGFFDWKNSKKKKKKKKVEAGHFLLLKVPPPPYVNLISFNMFFFPSEAQRVNAWSVFDKKNVSS